MRYRDNVDFLTRTAVTTASTNGSANDIFDNSS
jgi:hypothetical protein